MGLALEIATTLCASCGGRAAVRQAARIPDEPWLRSYVLLPLVLPVGAFLSPIAASPRHVRRHPACSGMDPLARGRRELNLCPMAPHLGSPVVLALPPIRSGLLRSRSTGSPTYWRLSHSSSIRRPDGSPVRR